MLTFKENADMSSPKRVCCAKISDTSNVDHELYIVASRLARVAASIRDFR